MEALEDLQIRLARVERGVYGAKKSGSSQAKGTRDRGLWHRIDEVSNNLETVANRTAANTSSLGSLGTLS